MSPAGPRFPGVNYFVRAQCSALVGAGFAQLFYDPAMPRQREARALSSSVSIGLTPGSSGAGALDLTRARVL